MSPNDRIVERIDKAISALQEVRADPGADGVPSTLNAVRIYVDDAKKIAMWGDPAAKASPADTFTAVKDKLCPGWTYRDTRLPGLFFRWGGGAPNVTVHLYEPDRDPEQWFGCVDRFKIIVPEGEGRSDAPIGRQWPTIEEAAKQVRERIDALVAEEKLLDTSTPKT